MHQWVLFQINMAVNQNYYITLHGSLIYKIPLPSQALLQIKIEPSNWNFNNYMENSLWT